MQTDTVVRVRRATAANAALALATAVVAGFVLGFATQAFGAEPPPPALGLAEAAAALDRGVLEAAARLDDARREGDHGLGDCISRSLLVAHGAQRALRNAEDDHALARMRGDERAVQLSLERAARADLAGRTLLSEAAGCASTESILGRGAGYTVLRIRSDAVAEDTGFGPPPVDRPPPGR
jgi:hypothetical protein